MKISFIWFQWKRMPHWIENHMKNEIEKNFSTRFVKQASKRQIRWTKQRTHKEETKLCVFPISLWSIMILNLFHSDFTVCKFNYFCYFDTLPWIIDQTNFPLLQFYELFHRLNSLIRTLTYATKNENKTKKINQWKNRNTQRKNRFEAKIEMNWIFVRMSKMSFYWKIILVMVTSFDRKQIFAL